MKDKLFVIALIVLNIGAAVQSIYCKDIRLIIYYIAAAVLNAAVGL